MNTSPVVREPNRYSSWLALLLLLPLLFIGGYLIGNTIDNNRNQTEISASNDPRFGVGGGPGTPLVTPIPENDNYSNEQELTTPLILEELKDSAKDETVISSPSASPQTMSPSPTIQRTGGESSI